MTDRKRYYMGIDGGGTKTKFVLADKEGSIFASHTGGPCHYLQVGLDALTQLMDEGTESLIAAANECLGAGSEEKICRDNIAAACAGLAGYGDVASDSELIKEAVAKGLGSIPFRVVNDCEIALAGALEGTEGICIIAGTGAIAYGRSDENGTMRCGGWNHVLGSDEGSGYWLGWSMLREFGRQSDGRDEKTLLYEKMKEILGIDADDEMVKRVVEDWGLDRTKIASLAPAAGELYDAGDPFAIDLIQRGAAELADLAVSLYQRLGFSKEKNGIVPVSGAGSIFKLGTKLMDPLTEILGANGMKWRESAGTPEEGAVLLAMRADTL